MKLDRSVNKAAKVVDWEPFASEKEVNEWLGGPILQDWFAMIEAEEAEIRRSKKRKT